MNPYVLILATRHTITRGNTEAVVVAREIKKQWYKMNYDDRLQLVIEITGPVVRGEVADEEPWMNLLDWIKKQ